MTYSNSEPHMPITNYLLAGFRMGLTLHRAVKIFRPDIWLHIPYIYYDLFSLFLRVLVLFWYHVWGYICVCPRYMTCLYWVVTNYGTHPFIKGRYAPYRVAKLFQLRQSCGIFYRSQTLLTNDWIFVCLEQI